MYAHETQTICLPFSLTDEVIERIFAPGLNLKGTDWLILARANVINFISEINERHLHVDEQEQLGKNKKSPNGSKNSANMSEDDFFEDFFNGGMEDAEDEDAQLLSQLKVFRDIFGFADAYHENLFAIYPFENSLHITFTGENRESSDAFLTNLSAFIPVWLRDLV